MFNIRYGAFETNSSSMHAMVVYTREKVFPWPTRIVFRTNYFGWAFKWLQTIDEKASYLYTSLCLVTDAYTAERIIREALEPFCVGCIFYAPKETEYGWYENCDIDHGADEDFVRTMISSPAAIIQFLFDDKSYVVTGNDNCDEESYKWWQDLAHPQPEEDYIVYRKSN